MYTSSLFKSRRRYAEAVTDEWFILSAKHGLLSPWSEIEPYELSLDSLSRLDRSAWTVGVLSQLLDAVGEGCPYHGQPNYREASDAFELPRIEVHAGKDYASSLCVMWRSLVLSPIWWPVEGLGIPQQLAWYRDNQGAAELQGRREWRCEVCGKDWENCGCTIDGECCEECDRLPATMPWGNRSTLGTL